MADLRVRHRARMREKDLKQINDALAAHFGLAAPPFPASTERADAGDAFDVLLAGGRAIGIILKNQNDRPALSVRGLLANRPTRKHVTVDLGAVKFVANGADIMAPGIVEADPSIVAGDLVWVRDEKNGQPLALGEALVAGPAMPRGPKGKAVKSIAYVGDPLWNLEV